MAIFFSLQGSCAGTYRDVLKMGVSIFMSALIFPVLVYGGHVFLPFDAPMLDSAPLRLVYTLRCSVFAVVPIVLGKEKATKKKLIIFASFLTRHDFFPVDEQMISCIVFTRCYTGWAKSRSTVLTGSCLVS